MVGGGGAETFGLRRGAVSTKLLWLPGDQCCLYSASTRGEILADFPFTIGKIFTITMVS